MRVGILVSGRGSNLRAILESKIPSIEPVLVISNRPDVPALAIADHHGVRSSVMRRADYPDTARRDAAIGEALHLASVEVAVLAGYDQVLRPSYFAAYRGRTINVHPSLLPAHGGAGMVGLAVHRSVIASGDRKTGVTIHEVTADLDAGPILAQVRIPVLATDDAEALAARVLAEEHRVLVSILAEMASMLHPAPGTMRASMIDGAPSGAQTTQERPGSY